jgi:hypothetical protein
MRAVKGTLFYAPPIRRQHSDHNSSECFDTPHTTGQLFTILILVFQFSFFLQTKQGLFLNFSFAFIFFSTIAHISFSFLILSNNNDHTAGIMNH